MDVLPDTKSLREVPPWDSGSVVVDNRFHKKAVIAGGHPNCGGSTRQKILDTNPLVIKKRIAARTGHAICPTHLCISFN
jgi:hypothetical protein